MNLYHPREFTFPVCKAAVFEDLTHDATGISASKTGSTPRTGILIRPADFIFAYRMVEHKKLLRKWRYHLVSRTEF